MNHYLFKGDTSEMEVFTESEITYLKKAKSKAYKSVEVKLNVNQIKLMKLLSKSVNTKDSDILRDYLTYSRNQLITLKK
jgi:hypothetical protein